MGSDNGSGGAGGSKETAAQSTNGNAEKSGGWSAVDVITGLMSIAGMIVGGPVGMALGVGSAVIGGLTGPAEVNFGPGGPGAGESISNFVSNSYDSSILNRATSFIGDMAANAAIEGPNMGAKFESLGGDDNASAAQEETGIGDSGFGGPGQIDIGNAQLTTVADEQTEPAEKEDGYALKYRNLDDQAGLADPGSETLGGSDAPENSTDNESEEGSALTALA